MDDDERPPDLWLSLAQSQRENAPHGVFAPISVAMILVTLLVAASIAATLFGLARSVSGDAREDKEVQHDLKPLAKGTVARPSSTKVAGRGASYLPKPVVGIGPTKAAGEPGSVIQLGAYRSQADAERAWTALATRFPSVAAMSKLIVPFHGGSRLRAAALSASEAERACQKLKAAGENCFVAQ